MDDDIIRFSLVMLGMILFVFLIVLIEIGFHPSPANQVLSFLKLLDSKNIKYDVYSTDSFADNDAMSTVKVQLEQLFDYGGKKVKYFSICSFKGEDFVNVALMDKSGWNIKVLDLAELTKVVNQPKSVDVSGGYNKKFDQLLIEKGILLKSGR